MKRCIVAGGGLAGLAAALRLSASPDMSVTLCESAPAPGGRARSFVDRVSGDEIDNGQHVLMGCYRATLRYLAEAGLSDPPLLRMRGFALPFVHADGRHSVLQAGGLPHPLSLVQALLRYDMLPFGARLRILRAVMRLCFQTERAWRGADGKNASAWLRECGQREKELAHFWRPLILATMNTEAESASAKLFSTVLREIFLGEPDAADMLLPATALSTLFVDPARKELERRGVRILSGTAVSAVEIVAEQTPAADGRRGGRVAAVRCGALRQSADAVLLAVPPSALSRIVLLRGMESGSAELPQSMQELLPGTELAAFTPSEILSLHVWLRRSLGDSPMTGLLGTSVQWVFFKGRTPEGLFHYSCTISSARGDETGDRAALRALLLRELRLLDAGLCDDDFARVLPIREKRATFIPRPGLEGQRPDAVTSVPGLFLAGDWTATGLPATIEGAIRSGYAAADSVLNGR